MPIVGQIRTPSGGMNQDDSLITPSKGAAGRNMFQLGDYRYALNARIGSSREDNFGDLENIRDTVEVTNYFSYSSVLLNGNFQGSLDNWDQTDDGYLDWAYNAAGARITITPDSGGSAGPTPQYTSKGTVSATTDATVTPQYPAGIQSGDLLFLIAISKQSLAEQIIVPAGWTLLQGNYYNNSTPSPVGYAFLCYKVADGTEVGTETVSRNGITGGLNSFMAQIYTWRGVAPQIESSSINALGNGNATVTWNPVAVGGINRGIIAFVAQQSSSTPDTPTGYTAKADDSVDAGPVSLSFDVSTKEGVSSDGSVTATGGHVDGWMAFHVSIYDPTSVPIPTDFTSEVIYQTVSQPIAGMSLPFSFNLRASNTVSAGTVSIVYMSGSSIVSEVEVFNGSISNFTYGETITVPDGVDGIGIRVEGTVDVVTTVDLPFVNLVYPSQGSKPSGDEKVIGKYEDAEFLRLYYFVWNSNNNHCIRYYDPITNSIYEVLRWSGLNFGQYSFVKAAKLDNWMAFTDRVNRPRLIDVNTITALQLTLGDEFREFHISFHKWAPTPPPIPRLYYDGATNNYERLKDKVFHFAYRYIYKGNLKSCWSPISKGATTSFLANTFYGNRNITSIELDIPGAILDDPSDTSTEYNYFDHADIKFTSAVDYIDVAFQDGELELWKLWKRIPVNSGFNRLHYFDGTGNLTPIPTNDFIQPFDTVPFLAGTVEAVDNRFVFGDCLDEKPPVTGVAIDDISSTDNTSSGDTNWGDTRTIGFAGITGTARAKLQRLNAMSRLTFKDRSKVKFGIQCIYDNGWRTGVYTTDEWVYEHEDIAGYQSGIARTAFNFSIPASFVPPEGAVAYQIMRTNSLSLDYYMYGIVNRFRPVVDDLSLFFNQLDLPDNVKNRIRQHFENTRTISGDDVIAETQKILQQDIDANRKRDRGVKIGNTLLEINRWIGELSGSAGFAASNRNLQKWLKRNPVGPKLQQELRKTKEIDLLANASRLLIDINNWYFGAKEATDKEFPLNNLFYNFREGDRIRFVGAKVANPTADQLEEFDVPIIEFTGQSILIEKPTDLLWISTPAVASPFNFNVEVYTPKSATQTDHLFYEMGEWYPILYPGQTNRDFAKRDFVWVNQGVVTLSQYGPFDVFNKIPVFYGESYLVQKTIYRDKTLGPASSESPMFTSMSPNYNKTFDYWDTNNGRVSIAYSDLPVERFKPTQCRFGGKIVEESNVNAINRFRDEDQFIYPSEYGRIRDLVNTSNAQVESVGSILLAIGERESWSIYVNRTTLEDLSGRTQVGISDQVLGSFNTLLGSQGTFNPESVCKERGRVWWWNALSGTWVRYGRDGLTEISHYKMRNWFREIGQLVINKYQDTIKPLVIAEFDPFNEELVTFHDHSSMPSTFRGYEKYKGVLFSEDDTRWKSVHTYQPELFGKLVNQLICFKNGNVFLTEQGSNHSTFFGTKYDVMWEPVFNDDMQWKKGWKAFAEVCTDMWSVDRILSEYRGAKTKQQTTIPLNLFEEKEDNYYAAIRRDVNTPNGVNPEVEGDLMRSKAIQVLMKLDPDVVHKSLLHYVVAEVTDSPKNP